MVKKVFEKILTPRNAKAKFIHAEPTKNHSFMKSQCDTMQILTHCIENNMLIEPANTFETFCTKLSTLDTIGISQNRIYYTRKNKIPIDHVISFFIINMKWLQVPPDDTCKESYKDALQKISMSLTTVGKKRDRTSTEIISKIEKAIQQMERFPSINRDMVGEILSHADIPTLDQACLVNREWNRIAKKIRLQKHFETLIDMTKECPSFQLPSCNLNHNYKTMSPLEFLKYLQELTDLVKSQSPLINADENIHLQHIKMKLYKIQIILTSPLLNDPTIEAPIKKEIEIKWAYLHLNISECYAMLKLDYDAAIKHSLEAVKCNMTRNIAIHNIEKYTWEKIRIVGFTVFYQEN